MDVQVKHTDSGPVIRIDHDGTAFEILGEKVGLRVSLVTPRQKLITLPVDYQCILIAGQQSYTQPVVAHERKAPDDVDPRYLGKAPGKDMIDG